MRIGILSLYLGRNYGGILQQYALSEYLKSLGYEVVIINRQPNGGGFLKRLAVKSLGLLGLKRYKSALKHKMEPRRFIDQLVITRPVFSSNGFKRLCKNLFIDCIVYGSDQVWRREFEIMYGLDFFGVSTPADVKQIAYAPSFGLDEWEYTSSETAKIRESLSHFVALSSREESGVKLIAERLQLKASLVCDPTMLYDEEFYSKLTNSNAHETPYCFVYWLGDTNSMKNAIDIYKSKSDIDVVFINLRDNGNLPCIEEWLSLVKNAHYVITDSFHGTVFSLLFGHQFEVHCNRTGGYDRIKTLMHKLHLDYKLADITAPVDYDEVSVYLDSFREESRLFLMYALQ